MDIPQVLAVLRPGEDWGPCAASDSTYAQLAATWRSKLSAVPTLAQMQAQWNTLEANRPTAERDALRALAVFLATDKAAPNKLLRAALLVAMDEVNALRQWITAFKAAVAASTSLANLQTRVAALANTLDRTAAQIKPALASRISTPDAD